MKKVRKYLVGGGSPVSFDEWLSQNSRELLEGTEQQTYAEYQAYVDTFPKEKARPLTYDEQAMKEGFNKDSDGVFRKKEITENKNWQEYNDTFKMVNVALDATQAIAGEVNSAKAKRKERERLEKARYQNSLTNPYETGVNNVPVYMERGGSTGSKYDVPEVEGVQDNQANAELEEGEVFQHQTGSIQKVAESEPTHEDGGSMQQGVSRVLEDTSDKRKDKNSKALKVTPAEAEALLGFKPKRSVTHSKLYELATEHYKKKFNVIEKKIDKNLEYVKSNHGGKYAENSLTKNLEDLENFPTDGVIFDAIYDNQEQVKQEQGIIAPGNNKYGGKPKYAVGGKDDEYYTDPYTGAKTKKGGITPTGLDNKFNRGSDFFTKWDKVIPGFSKMKNEDAQRASYQYMMKHNPQAVADMWNKYGMTAKGLKSPGLSKEEAYVDGFFRVRQFDPPENPVLAVPPADTKVKSATDVKKEPDYGPIGPQIPDWVKNMNSDGTPADPTKYQKPEAVEASVFDEPLRWYDTMGNVLNYLSSAERTPVELEQLERVKTQVHEVNPLPTLLENQGDFNAALHQLPNNGVGFANQSALQATKYKANNQVLGQTENINKGKYDAKDQFEAQAEMQLDQVNLGLRDQFNNRVLQSREAQRVSKINALDDYFTKLAQNRKLNREGQLVLELTPYMDQYGRFNGNKYNVAPNGANFDISTKDGKVIKTITKNQYDALNQPKGSTTTVVQQTK